MIIDSKNIEEKKLINLINPKDKKILEIGCGKGRQAFLLSPFCFKYTATDADENIIATAKNKVPKELEKKLNFLTANGEKLPFTENSFDTVLMILCLHEISVQKQGLVLQEINRVLKKDGQLLIIDPTEPPGQVQQAFNIVYSNFEYFDHSTVVKYSILSIKKVISSDLFKLDLQSTYKIDWEFKNLKELVTFVIDCSQEIKWDKNKEQFLEKELMKIAKPKNIDDTITIYDGLTINSLIKNNAFNN